MGKDSKIGWTHHSWNPWIGCLKQSPACKFCYAEAMTNRFGGDFAKIRKVTSEANWKQPHKWSKDAASRDEYERVFCASLADIFEEWGGSMVNHKGEELYKTATGWTSEKLRATGERRKALAMDDVRRRMFTEFATLKNLHKLFLTKRPQNIISTIESSVGADWWKENCAELSWLGTTVENQEYADKRIPELLKCRDLAPVLFLSVEPMLGPVDLNAVENCLGDWNFSIPAIRKFVNKKPTIDWVICGTESGSNRRPTDLAWVRSLRDQCQAAGVAFFVKQLEIDGKVTEDISKFPEGLRIQEFPKVGHGVQKIKNLS